MVHSHKRGNANDPLCSKRRCPCDGLARIDQRPVRSTLCSCDSRDRTNLDALRQFRPSFRLTTIRPRRSHSYHVPHLYTLILNTHALAGYNVCVLRPCHISHGFAYAECASSLILHLREKSVHFIMNNSMFCSCLFPSGGKYALDETTICSNF